jgi:alpha/beta hydrolase fold
VSKGSDSSIDDEVAPAATNSRMWQPLLDRLAGPFRLVAPDYPGFGHSDAPSQTEFAYTFDHLAAVVGRFAEVLGLRRYALVVQDYGGPVGFPGQRPRRPPGCGQAAKRPGDCLPAPATTRGRCSSRATQRWLSPSSESAASSSSATTTPKTDSYARSSPGQRLLDAALVSHA